MDNFINPPPRPAQAPPSAIGEIKAMHRQNIELLTQILEQLEQVNQHLAQLRSLDRP